MILMTAETLLEVPVVNVFFFLKVMVNASLSIMVARGRGFLLPITYVGVLA